MASDREQTTGLVSRPATQTAQQQSQGNKPSYRNRGSMQIPIKRTLERLPGGMMIGPLALGCGLANLFPDGPKFFGSFTGALFSSPLTILAVFLVCLGSTISINATPEMLKKGGALFLTKVFCGVISAIVLKRLLGERPIESGIFAGLSTLAVVAAINDTNGGLYMALMAQFGKPGEAAAQSIMSMEG